jgi:hypothetical protein
MAWDQVWCAGGHVREYVPSQDGYTEIGDSCRVRGCKETIVYRTVISRGSFHGIIRPIPVDEAQNLLAEEKWKESLVFATEVRQLKSKLRQAENNRDRLQKEARLTQRFKVPDKNTRKLMIDEDHPNYAEWRKKIGRTRDDLWLVCRELKPEEH